MLEINKNPVNNIIGMNHKNKVILHQKLVILHKKEMKINKNIHIMKIKEENLILKY